MSKQHPSCKNNDGGTRVLLLGLFGVSENLPSISDLSPKPPLLWEGGSSGFTHILVRVQWWARGWVGVAA